MKAKKIVSLALAATLAMGTFLMVGCGGKDGGSGSTSKEKDPNQELNLIFMETQSWDVNKVHDAATGTVLNAVHEGLFRFKPNKDGVEEMVGAAAKEWKVSDDGLTYTITLRDGLKWSDDQPIKAQHYVDSARRLLDPKLANDYSFFAFGIKNGKALFDAKVKPEELGVVAKDDKTLEVTLEKADPTFLGKLAYQCFLPIRLDVIEKIGADNYSKDWKQQVFSGPFKVESYNQGNEMVLVKNEKFWDTENVAITKVNMKKQEEWTTQALNFEGKQLDVSAGTGDHLKKWKEEAKAGKFQYKTDQTPSNWYLNFNNQGGPSGIMSNAKVRKAFSLAVDRKEFTSGIYGRYTPAYGFIPGPITTSDEKKYRDQVEEPLKKEFDETAMNPEKLQALLKEGLKELGKDTTNLKDIKVKFLAIGTSALSKQANEFWKQTFESKLGITVEMEVMSDSKLYTAERKKMNFDVLFIGWNADYNDPLTFLDMWESTNGNNGAKYNNPKYDALLKTLDGENDPAKRLDIYKKLETMLVSEDVAIAPIFYNDMNVFMQNYVNDFYFPKFGATYEWRWSYISTR
ncbi:MAG: peptide ABC transporter substrate-binding protein [Clostridium sp.]